MSIADQIVARIRSAGYRVEVTSPDDNTSDCYFIRATDPATGRFWVTSGSTLADVASGLAHQLGLADSLSPSAHPFEPLLLDRSSLSILPRVPRRFATWPVVSFITATIFVIDLLSPGLNLGIFYLIPLSICRQIRPRAKHLFLLSSIMIVLIYADRWVGEWPIFHAESLEPGGLLNRGFAVLVIAVCTGLMLCFPRPRRSRRRPRPDVDLDAISPGAIPDQPRLFTWLVAGIIGGTFLLDVMTPVVANFPIFYLLPLALLALAGRRGSLWLMVSLLFGLNLIGFAAAPRSGVDAHDISLILTNRILTAGGLVLMASVFHLSTGKFFGGAMGRPQLGSPTLD